MGRRAVCQANLKQLYLGFSSYAPENDEWWVTGGYNHHPNWPRVVADALELTYIREQQRFPDFGAPRQPHSFTARDRDNGIFQCPSDQFANYWGGKNATSYGLNTGYTHGYAFGISDNYDSTDPVPWFWEYWGRVRTPKILVPENTFVLGDYIRADGYYDYNIVQFDTVDDLSDYHAGGGNLNWADGHVRGMRYGELALEHFDRRQ